MWALLVHFLALLGKGRFLTMKNNSQIIRSIKLSGHRSHFLLLVITLFSLLSPGFFGQSAQMQSGEPDSLLAPSLGNYPNTTITLGADTTVTPDATPAGATGINVSTNSNFNGTFAANPATGVVRVTNAYPAGTYTVTVRASGPSGTTTKTPLHRVNPPKRFDLSARVISKPDLDKHLK